MLTWTTYERQELLSAESKIRFNKARQKPEHFDDPLELRHALLDFIADFANWDNSTVPAYLDTARYLTAVAHRALTEPEFTLSEAEIATHLRDTKSAIADWPKPLVVDPFAGGGSIPLEALRVGADVFASDLNPIPVLLNKVILEYIPKYGQRLADEVRKWGAWIKEEAEKELAEFYPKDPDGATPIAYLWARTIRCEGPGCGAEVPLIRSLWLAKKDNRSVALQLVPNKKSKRVEFIIICKKGGKWVNQANEQSDISDPKFEGTVKRGSATCPCCGYTTPVANVRVQLKARHGGTADSLLLGVVSLDAVNDKRNYRLATDADTTAAISAVKKLGEKMAKAGQISFVPNETTEHYHSFVNRGPIYGMTTWADYFTPRQALVLGTYAEVVRKLDCELADPELRRAVQTICGLAVSRLSDICNGFCMWETSKTQVRHLFTKQAIPMMWDFAESCPFTGAAGDFTITLGSMLRFIEAQPIAQISGNAQQASAAQHPLPDDSVNAMVTDPPYYYSVQYADLSDFFYVWMRRTVGIAHPQLFALGETPKEQEIIVQSPGHQFASEGKNNVHYEGLMQKALSEGRRYVAPSGVAIVVFAHTSTTGWETLLQAMIQAGWIVTGSWPIDTELANRLISVGRSVLASSVHLVCRPREDENGKVREDEVGDWRDVLQELPKRIHEWMPRLDAEGVVGADAIFACLGPALEVFSRYSRVERASGEQVTLKEYLEHVWAAVSREALTMVFKDADVSGFEEDARLTAIWLWTLSTAAQGKDMASKVNNRLNEDESTEDEEENEDEGSGSKKKAKLKGFYLDYDAARKIAQGLGAHLEDMKDVVEVKGDTARLLPVAERTARLFGKADPTAAAAPKKKKTDPQLKLDLFAELTNAPAGEAETVWEEKTVTKVGDTTLDRIHQSMILFAAGRSEALKRFLVDDGAGKDPKFWRLAQALSALYPPKTEEKRWVDGVMARKKGLGV
jgi:adenine-specific DNA methylase